VEKSAAIWGRMEGDSGSRKKRLVVRNLAGGGDAGVNSVQSRDVNAHFHCDPRNSIRREKVLPMYVKTSQVRSATGMLMAVR
jgi:hypothetical protein